MDGSDGAILVVLFGVFGAMLIYDWKVRNDNE
jgi:hypothetical protein